MARHVDAWMDGIRLADLGAVLIQDVNEPEADQEITYGNRPGRAGQDVLSNKRRLLRVNIDIAIRELFDLGRRTAILQAVAGWASGDFLQLSNHPGQRLRVHQRTAPSLGAVRNYSEVMHIEFEAAVVPFWEEAVPVTVSDTAAAGEPYSGPLWIPGTADVPVEFTFTPESVPEGTPEPTLTDLTVTVACGGVTQEIQLTGMNVTGAVTFGRDEDDRMTIMNGETSLMRYRTQTSADDLVIPCGHATVSFEANIPGLGAFSARGRWL
jgi:hypothetical protein